MMRWTICAASLLVLPAFAQLPRPVVVNAVTDRFRPLALDQQNLTGILGERMRAAREGYLEHVNSHTLLEPFRQGPGASQALRPEAGRFLEAAANAYDYSRDPNLKKTMDTVAKDLIRILAGGSSVPDPGEQDGSSTSAWSTRCSLLGLIAYYRVTGDPAALSTAKKMADLVVRNLDKRPPERNPGGTLLIEPLLFLYRYTGDERYFTFSKAVASTAKSEGDDVASLEERLAGMNGLLELYRSTGDTSYYQQVASAWPALHANPFFLSSSKAAPETRERSRLPEACSIALWVRLNVSLLRLTGQPRFGEELERVTYNQLFAAQDPRTGRTYSLVPLSGEKTGSSSADRCVASEAMGIAEIPFAAWGRYGNGIAIVLYSGGRATFSLRRRGTVQIYAEATYPATGDILLHVEPSRSLQFPLRLRVPAWSARFVVDVGGDHLIGKPGDFVTVIREWKRGDTVRISVDMSVQAIRAGALPENEVAIQRGPQILALDTALNPEITDLAAAGPVSTSPPQLQMTALDARFPANWAGNQAYAIAGEYQGKPRRLVLTPFADALNYEVFMKAPVPVSGASSLER